MSSDYKKKKIFLESVGTDEHATKQANMVFVTSIGVVVARDKGSGCLSRDSNLFHRCTAPSSDDVAV